MGTERGRLVIQPYERIVVIGKTGTGKTHISKAYCNAFKNVLVLDTKGTFTWNKAPVIRTLDKLMKVGSGKFIYRPIDAEMHEDYYDAFFEFCYKRRHTVAFVDELAQVMENASDILPNWKNIMQRGRELNVGIFNCTQRPRGIPKMALSESEHTFCFRLKLEDDRKHVAEFMGREVVDVRLKKHGFIYMHESADKAIVMPDGIKL
jgi:hypothetical protein